MYIDINWNWPTAAGGTWSTWGDSEIQNNNLQTLVINHINNTLILSWWLGSGTIGEDDAVG